METIIKINTKNGKFTKSVSEIISEIALKLSYFIKENKLEDKKIEYRGKAKTKKSIEIKYRFVDNDNIIPFKLKVGRKNNEEIKDKGIRKIHKGS